MPRQPKNKPTIRPKYIFVEGKTEEIYFNFLKQRMNLQNIKVFLTGSHGISLWHKAKEKIKNDPKLMNLKDVDVYLIFDKDQLTQEDFNQVIKFSQDEFFTLGFSNSAFEVWLLAHFKKVTKKVISPQKLAQDLTVELGLKDKKEGYKKSNPLQLEKIVQHYKVAITNSAEIATADYDYQCTTLPHVIHRLGND